MAIILSWVVNEWDHSIMLRFFKSLYFRSLMSLSKYAISIKIISVLLIGIGLLSSFIPSKAKFLYIIAPRLFLSLLGRRGRLRSGVFLCFPIRNRIFDILFFYFSLDILQNINIIDWRW